ncbi:MAG TPA: DNA replication and repair protein RecF [Candidatus Binatia bacterium]|nr:DNA replication and repair protein RecF [Candidatus Binatia bacterium]
MITDIHLQNFRSYKDESFEFSPSVNIIVGPNGSGKTNLLEAILIAARGNSYRASDVELIAFNKPWARLEMDTEGSGMREVMLERREDGRAYKHFKLDDKPYLRLSLQRSLPVVVFEPNHLRLLTGSPEGRRQFLDDLLEQTKPGYSSLLRRYKRILAQRNSLLKQRQVLANQLFVWDVRLSETAALIVEARSQISQEIDKQIEPLYMTLAQNSAKAKLSYQTLALPEHYASTLLKRLEAHRSEDIERGFTTYGPHREDLLISLNGHLAQATASRGETRTLLLVLKAIEATLLEDSRNQRPLLLLDDVFSELDGARRQALTSFLQPYQTFITTTDADVVIQHFTETTNIIPLG